MGNKHREAIVATGLICGYVATVLQSTDGPANIFKGLRYASHQGVRIKGIVMLPGNSVEVARWSGVGGGR